MKPLLLLAALTTSLAQAAPVGNETVWYVTKAIYNGPQGILWGLTKAKELDGSTLTFGCQSGPFTPHASDGRLRISDVTQKRDPNDPRGLRVITTGTAEISKRYADGAESCENLLKWVAKTINQSHRSRVALDRSTGEISITPAY